MKNEHGYALGNLAIAIIASILVVVFFELEEENSPWVIYPFALAPSLFCAIFILAKVKVNEEEIRIDYIVPFRRARIIRHEDIESYGAIKGTNGKGKATFGLLKARNEKNAFMLSSLGTKNFPELSEFLESTYTPVNKTHNQSG